MFVSDHFFNLLDQGAFFGAVLAELLVRPKF
jgi:hypothetical protein